MSTVKLDGNHSVQNLENEVNKCTNIMISYWQFLEVDK